MRDAAAFSVALVLCSSVAYAQVRIRGRIVDRSGVPVIGASVATQNRAETSSIDGTWSMQLSSVPLQGVDLRVRAQSLAERTVHVEASAATSEIEVILQPSTVLQQATVTATRSSFAAGPNAVTEATLSGEQLRSFPALTLDESLRQHAGLELFRRSSGWVQNPTSQGISLRGLGSTAASRTLVLADLAPLNDPFGGWVHWNELPSDAIEAVTVSSGGGSDLYGSSALGGVIDLLPAQPIARLGMLDIGAAGEDTRRAGGRVDLQEQRWHALLAAEDLRTGGYILVAPEARGPVDVPANVHFESSRSELTRELARDHRIFATGNLLNEARGNGTPLTTNGTRLWRYMGGSDWSVGARTSGRVRVFGTDEGYRQSFSAIAPQRTTEILSRTQRVKSQEFGASADSSLQVGRAAIVAGADLRDVRATDFERPTASVLRDTTARQRFVGGFAEALGARGAWSGAASLRIDNAANLDARVLAGPSRSALANRSEIVVSPRIGVVRQLTGALSLRASGFRAFRAPTMNELYRTGQVGQETTLANQALVSERATGAEGGLALERQRLRLQGSYFWTTINRPVAAVFLSSTATTILEQRENLGQIQSQGVEVTAALDEDRLLSASFGYQYAHSIVTKFSAQPSLVGKWIPEVPREAITAQIHLKTHRYGDYSLAARAGGRAYDDSANSYVLHTYLQLDAFAEKALGKGLSVYTSVQNLLDRRADVARTPVLTQGIPLVAAGGLRFRWGLQ